MPMVRQSTRLMPWTMGADGEAVHAVDAVDNRLASAVHILRCL